MDMKLVTEAGAARAPLSCSPFRTAGRLVLAGLVLLVGVAMWHLFRPAPVLARAEPSGPLQRAAPPSLAPRAAGTRAAGNLYVERCQSCHGADGTGRGTRAPIAETPDFTSREWQERRSDTQLLAGILEGAGTQMPAFRGTISAEQAQDLVAYIRAFGPTLAKPVADRPSDFDKRFRQLQEQLEELQRQFRELSPPPPKP
jgi:mono/diheme cytochrome c family protein